MSRLVIHDRRSLEAARLVIDHDAVEVRTARLKSRGLLPCALKYALWAVRLGGRIIVQDDAAKGAGADAYALSFNAVRWQVFRFLGRDVAVEAFDAQARRLVLTRTTPVLAPGWSAGVVFSGAEAEIPTLLNCLGGLTAQPELSPAAGGEIVVCGPARDLGFLQAFPDIRYLPYETPPGPRLPIGAKKNALIEVLGGPRLAILHARVVLDPGALAAAPREFDISGPGTVTLNGGRRDPYLSLIATDALPVGRPPRFNPRTMRHADPLALHQRGGLFVDGGAFFVTKRVHAACPLDPHIAWQEMEDVDWCARAFAAGWLIDIAPQAGAVSQTAKLRPPPPLGPLTRPALNALTAARETAAALRHHLQAWMGRR